MRWTPAATLMMTLAAMTLPGCGGDPAAPDPIVLTGMFTLSGDNEDIQSRRATRLAIRDINAGGGIRIAGGRRPLRVAFVDDRADPQVGVQRANEILSRPETIALLGPGKSQVAVPVGAVAERSGIPMISPTSTNPATTRGRRFVFRTTFTDDVQGAIAARFARSRLHASTAAIAYEATSLYSAGLARSFRREFAGTGGRVVSASYTVDQGDHTAPIERLARHRPDVLYLPNASPDVEWQAERARRRGLDATLLGGDAWNLNRYREIPGFDGSYATGLWFPDSRSARSRRFTSAFQTAYGIPPTGNGAAAYDAVHLLARAITAAGTTEPEAIRDALDAITVYDGVAGRFVYARGGDPRTGAVVVRIKAGGAAVAARYPATQAVRPAAKERR
ncbi:MAG: ABC transporter substrate-binding protein [Solirubrobacteraceae bacterium]|nr:ABC transporter substrate-binding protein [Solirubrobacteraceae bacterium]